METMLLRTISIWVLIILLLIFLIPLIDMLITTIEMAYLRHKMRKELRKAANLSRSNLQQEIYNMIDEITNETFDKEEKE